MAAYDTNNIFAKILRGELPAHKVYEDDKTFVFLDIMPRAIGHALVIPKAPARNLLDVDASDLAAVMKIAQPVARAGMKAFDAQGVTVQQFNEPAGGSARHSRRRRAGSGRAPTAPAATIRAGTGRR
jgi:histidine triad (HIT) family protein